MISQWRGAGPSLVDVDLSRRSAKSDASTPITSTVPFGCFVRSIYKWAATLMIITVLLHMGRVFFSCEFRQPRQLNWVIGCGLLLGTLGLAFTGYSLIYEQLSYWGVTVASELVAVTPVVGDVMASFMRQVAFLSISG